jgi:hypothetical protein
MVVIICDINNIALQMLNQHKLHCISILEVIANDKLNVKYSYSKIKNFSNDIRTIVCDTNNGIYDKNTSNNYMFDENDMRWSVFTYTSKIKFLIVTSVAYPIRIKTMLMTELQAHCNAINIGENGNNGGNAICTVLSQLHTKYSNVANIDKLNAIQSKVDTVAIVMKDNIDIALKNTVIIEEIEKDSEDLLVKANVFKDMSRGIRNKMWWKQMKTKIFIGVIVLAILAMIIGVAVGSTNTSS